MSDEHLTPEEERILKELAKNLLASGRIGRVLRSGVIWLASLIGAVYVVLELFLKQRGG